jgi:hypothetical protein
VTRLQETAQDRQQNAQGAYSSTDEVKEEVKCIKAIIEVKPSAIII